MSKPTNAQEQLLMEFEKLSLRNGKIKKAENLRLALRIGSLKYADLTQDQLELLDQFPEEEKECGADNKAVLREICEKQLAMYSNTEFAPEILSSGVVVAGYYIEEGVIKFADFAETMINTIGPKIKPYLKACYEGVRRFPGMENIAKEMDSTSFVDEFDLNIFNRRSSEMNIRERMDLLELYGPMERLQHLAQYEKENLIAMIQNGTILDDLKKASDRAIRANENIRKMDLPPGGAGELLNQAATMYDPQMEMSDWTKREARIVNLWWEKTFPEEENPLYLDEDDLPETLDDEQEKTPAEKMTLADLIRMTR